MRNNKVSRNKAVSYNYMIIIIISIVILMLSVLKVPVVEMKDIIFDNYQMYMVFLVVYILIGFLVAKRLCKTGSIFLLFGYYYFLFLVFNFNFFGLIGFTIINPIILYIVIGNTFTYLIILFIIAVIQQLIIDKYFCNHDGIILKRSNK